MPKFLYPLFQENSENRVQSVIGDRLPPTVLKFGALRLSINISIVCRAFVRDIYLNFKFPKYLHSKCLELLDLILL
jgi:hypothetical protein